MMWELCGAPFDILFLPSVAHTVTIVEVVVHISFRVCCRPCAATEEKLPVLHSNTSSGSVPMLTKLFPGIASHDIEFT